MTNYNVKLLALDIDGTLMNKEFQISDNVKKAIKKVKQKGVKVLLATGRMHIATVDIAKELGLDGPILSYQGSLVKELDGFEYIHHTINTELSRKLVDELRSFDIQINCYINDKLYSENQNEIIEEYCEKRNIEYTIESFDNLEKFNNTKILAIGEDADKMTEITHHLKEKYKNELYVTKSTPYFCEIASIKASKGNAILYMAKKYGIKQKETMAIGDQNNDKEMLEAVNIAVAMGNATDELKEVSNYITDSIDNDGATKAIEKFILEVKNDSRV